MLVAAPLLLVVPGAAHAQELVRAPSPDKAPEGYELTPREVIGIARGTEEARSERRVRPELDPTAYTNGPGRWQVSFTARGDEHAQVHIEDGSGRVVEAWTGPQVAWKMARGYDGAFGGMLNAPYVWLPLCLVFLIPFVDVRRPLRIIHLDLLVLLGFGASHVFFNRGEIFASVPLVYPALVYLLARMLWTGLRPRERRERLVPHFPWVALALAVVFLVGFRVTLNVADSSVIDVGYAGVIGADRIVDGEGLYDGDFHDENEHGDTYGPANYLAYVPFEQAFSWSGEWDDLPAGHAAAIAFDLLTILGLFLLGRRLRPGEEGRMLGTALAFAWASYPYTAYVLQSNANDSLVAMLVVYALLALGTPALRGALVGLAATTKFGPLALVPLLARGSGARQPWRRRARTTLPYALAFAAVLVASVVLFLPEGGLAQLYERTVGYQAGRDSPFSIWGQVDWLGPVRVGLFVGIALLALAVAVVPRDRDRAQVAALGAAVLIAVQLLATHWFYLYIAWFAPLVLVGLFAGYRGIAEPAAERAAEKPAAARKPVPA